MTNGVAPGHRRAVLLDRDGVLVESAVVDGVPHPAASEADLRVLPGVLEACAALRTAAFLLVCVTNQPDIARGLLEPRALQRVNRALQAHLGLTGILVCPHDDVDACACRKPKPGLLLEAARRWSLSLEDSVLVGDRWRDVAAGRAAGCRTVYVDHGYTERRPTDADLVVHSLAEAVPWIVSTPGGLPTTQETRACST